MPVASLVFSMEKAGKPLTSEVFERYALGLARGERLAPDDEAAERSARRAGLLERLAADGIQGWPDRGTFYTRGLPSGCVPCLKGRGSNLCLTTLCNRDCFFCFNPKPRAEGLSVHGRTVASESEIAGVLADFGIESVGLSGGEPLLDAERTIRIIKELRRRFGPGLRIDLYTNGDLLTPRLAARLRDAGIDGTRMNLAAGGYRIAPLKIALGAIPDSEVELPVIPKHIERLKRLIREMDEIGAPQLILHELFVSAQNLDAMKRMGLRAAAGPSRDRLSWSPVAGSDVAALELLLFALKNTKSLSVYYCSTSTQQWIAEQALAAAASRKP